MKIETKHSALSESLGLTLFTTFQSSDLHYANSIDTIYMLTCLRKKPPIRGLFDGTGDVRIYILTPLSIRLCGVQELFRKLERTKYLWYQINISKYL